LVGPSNSSRWAVLITRWGFKRFIDAGALDILQSDIYRCGGLSETLKIAAYATVHDLITRTGTPRRPESMCRSPSRRSTRRTRNTL
jgi:hypothetical protein